MTNLFENLPRAKKRLPARTGADTLGDTGVMALKGAVAVPQTVVSKVPWGTSLLKRVGYRPGEAQEILERMYSEQQQLANRNVSQADGFINTLKALSDDPSVAAITVGESIFPMLLGGLYARGLMALAPKVLPVSSVSPVAAGAIGEGLVGAGSAASQIREETDDGILTARQSLSALGSGIGTAVFGYGGGRFTRGMGLGDIDTIIARGGSEALAAGHARMGFIRQMAGSGISEGLFEELPQAIQEQMWQNFALGRPLDHGIGNAAALGLASGTIMGSGAGGYSAVTQRPGLPEQRTPDLRDYEEAVRRVFGRREPPASSPASPKQAPAAAPAPTPEADVVNRILLAIDQIQNDPRAPQAHQAEAGATTGRTSMPETAPPGTPENRQAPAAGEVAKQPVLQNRNRASPSSIAQVRSIGSRPDYGRLGFSRDFVNGAPVVAGGQIAPERLGRKDMAVASDGRRIPVQYAVVEAADVLASHRADGTPNPDYGNQAVQRIRAIAGNARIGGLQLAYHEGTARDYALELASDPMHGVNQDEIRVMSTPVLVRVMPASHVTENIGDVSNTVGTLELSATEQANNDARRVNLDALQFAEDGSITPEAVRQFVRAMPQAEQGGLIDTNGQPTRQAISRIEAAVFAKAYGNDQLIRLFAQAKDPEARNVLSALAQVAPKMARLEGAGALDIRGVVTQAAEIAVNARRGGIALSRAAKQMDMAADPDVGVVLEMFARNARSVKPVVESLSRAADFAYTEASKAGEDMFGEVPRADRADVINELGLQNEQTSQEALENPAGQQPAEQDAGRQTFEPARPAAPAEAEAGRSTEAEVLTSYSDEEINQRIERLEQAENERKATEARVRQEEARERERLEVRRRSEAAAGNFRLGQNPMDNLTGQGNLLFESDARYDAKTPRPHYTNDRQLQLFLDTGPVESQAGPRGEAAQRAAVAAVDDIRSTETILGLALSRDYAARQRVSLVGQKVSGTEDLAVLAQVYRDPRFETFRVLFVNDAGKVVSQLGLTSRLPGSAQAIIGNDADAYLAGLSATARNRGASGYYMLHNHPSGISAVSKDDIKVTMNYARKMPMLEFRSHVVIDTNEYTTIDAAGRSETRKKDLGQPSPYRAQEWANAQIMGSDDVMAMAGRLQVDDGAITLIHTDNQLIVMSISTIPHAASAMSSQELKKLVLRASLKTQGAQVFAVGRDRQALVGMGDVVVDAVHVEDSGKASSLRVAGAIEGGSPRPATRRARLSPDTGPEFDYLRRRSLPVAQAQFVAEEQSQSGLPAALEARETDVSKSIKRDLETYPGQFPPSMPAEMRQEILKWGVVSKSPYSDSYYDITNKSWDDDPDEFLRASDHWNFESGGRTHAQTINGEPPENSWTIARHLPSGGYEIIKSVPKLEYDSPSHKQNLALRQSDFERRKADDAERIKRIRAAIDEAIGEKIGKYPESPLKGAGYKRVTLEKHKVDKRRAALIAALFPEHIDEIWITRSSQRHVISPEVAVIALETLEKANAARLGAKKGGAPVTPVDPDSASRVSEPFEDERYVHKQTQTPNRGAVDHVKFRIGEVAYDKLSVMMKPMLDRFGMGRASPALRKQLRHMKGEIDKAKRTAALIAREMSVLSEADRAMVSDVVEKMLAPGVVPPEHVVRIADAITRVMDMQTDELVKVGMLSKESAERWRGQYLPRFYSRETELVDDPLVQKLFKTGMPGIHGIGGGSLKGRGLFQDVSLDAVDKWIAMGFEVRDPHWTMMQGKLDLVDKNAPQVAKEKVTVWRDWTPAERANMGEIRDAMYRFVVGYTAMQRDIAMGHLFNNIASNPEWARRSGSDGWVQVPDIPIPGTGGVKRYGNLSGLYVPIEVMNHMSQFEESASDALRLYREAMGLWKEGKTALNPVAHFNNIVGNLSMAHFAGVSYWDTHKYAGAVRDLINDAPMVDEARDHGLFTGSFTSEELMESMPPELQKIANMQESVARLRGRQVLNALTFWLRQPLRNAYEYEDVFFKYLIYRDARLRGLSPEDAVDYALRYIFAYDDLPSGARKVRDYAIPFFGWTYKAIPALLHTAMVYPWRFLAPAALIHSINTVAYALAAGDEDDNWLEQIDKGRELEKKERSVLPERMQGMGVLFNPKTIRLGTDSLTGHTVFLDASRLIPGGDMFDMINQAGGIPLPAPLMPNHPVLSAFSAMIANREIFFGRNIVDPNDTPGEAFEKRAKWMAGLLLPAVSPGGYHSQRILNATAHAMDTVITTPLGEFTGVDRSGLPVQPKYAAMQTVGIKARPVDLELEAQRRKAQENMLIRSIAAEVRSMARLHQRGAVSDQKMEQTRERAREKLKRIQEEGQ